MANLTILVPLVTLVLLTTAADFDPDDLNTFRVPNSSDVDSDQPYGSICESTNASITLGCGIPTRINGRNIPGDVAAFGEFPWQVAVLDAYEQRFLCSGVLLSSKAVLTAARCVADVPIDDLRVRLGEWDILSDLDPREAYRSLELHVSKKLLHEEHDGQRSVGSDRRNTLRSVTLLKLRQPVPWGQLPHVAPACLPYAELMNELQNLRCHVAGWGESRLQPLQRLQGSEDMKVEVRTPTTSSGCTRHEEETGTCWGTTTPRPRAAPRGVGEDDTLQSRLLGKAPTLVVSHQHCTSLHGAQVDQAELCLLPVEDSIAHPCQADIGAPVLCEVAVNTGKRSKPGQLETGTRVVVVGVVTRSFACDDVQKTGPEAQRPVIAVNLLGVLEPLCRATGLTKH